MKEKDSFKTDKINYFLIEKTCIYNVICLFGYFLDFIKNVNI